MDYNQRMYLRNRKLKMINNIKLQIKEQQQVLKDYQDMIKIKTKNINKLNNQLQELINK